jgi:hypothetical protein
MRAWPSLNPVVYRKQKIPDPKKNKTADKKKKTRFFRIARIGGAYISIYKFSGFSRR